MKKSMFAIVSLLLVVLLMAVSCSKTTSTSTNPPQTQTTTTTTQTPSSIQSSIPPVGPPPPTVSSTAPADGEADVPVNYLITATFASEGSPDNFTNGMAPASININTFTLWQGTTAIPGTVTYFGDTAIFDPASDLTKGLLYTAKITKGVTDKTGVHMANDFVWIFTTGAADTVAPTVAGTTPGSGDDSVPTNNEITAFFSEPMDPNTINANNFTLMQGTTAVPGTVNYDGVRTAIFNPTNDLTPNTIYTAKIAGVTCSAGRPMAAAYTWDFTTGTPQATVPTVTSTIPAAGAAGIPINNSITATFSEPMDPMTINVATFQLWQGTAQIVGTVEWDGIDTAVFIPDVDLAMNATYTVKITSDVTDAGGIHMATDKSWSFSTGTADTTIPSIANSIPSNGSTGIAVNAAINITFSEAMDPTSVTFSLMQGTTVVPCDLTWSSSLKTLNASPSSPLTNNTIYTIGISGGTDLAGIGSVDVTWSFTTAILVSG